MPLTTCTDELQHGWTALLVASSKGYLGLVQLILAARPDTEAREDSVRSRGLGIRKRNNSGPTSAWGAVVQ